MLNRSRSGIVTVLCSLMLLISLPTGNAHAAQVPLFSGDPTGTTPIGGASREIFFRALDDVSVEGLGVLADLTQPTVEVNWRIFQADRVGLSIVIGSEIYASGNVTLNNAGQITYTTNIAAPVVLAEDAYYMLSLQVVSGSGMTLVTSTTSSQTPAIFGGLFQVFADSSGTNNYNKTGSGGNWNNAIWPSFTIIIPEPASMAAMLLLGTGLLLRRRHQR